jgi:hypothetical protein
MEGNDKWVNKGSRGLGVILVAVVSIHILYPLLFMVIV